MFRLTILVVLAAVVGMSSAVGPICEAGRACVAGQAECKGGACVCSAPAVWGAGTFACYKKNQVAAEIKNDPMLTNFNNETVSFPFPCRYLVTHIKQQLKDKDRKVIGKCEFQVHAFNGKNRGKFFVHGFDVAAKISYDDGREVKLSSRNFGLADDGSYSFTRKGTDGKYLPNGPWGDDTVEYKDADNRIEVKVYLDDRNHQLVYEFKKCGLQITFVPYDVIKRRSQPVVPGVSVGINCAYHPQWLGYDNVMGLSPSWEGGALFADHRKPKLTDEQSMVVRAFTRGYEHNQPYDDDGACDLGGKIFGKCTDSQRHKAMKSCFWMMKAHRYLRCIETDRSAKKTLTIFAKCVDMFCGSMKCQDVIDMIDATGCSRVGKHPQLVEFMAGNLCPS